MSNTIAICTLARKEIYRVFRIWKQTIVPPLITTTLYFLIFGTMIGSRIGTIEGVSYMTYITPGLIMMSVITGAFGNSISSFYLAKYSKSIEEMLISPLSAQGIILGYLAGSLSRSLSSALLVFAVAYCFVDLPLHSLTIALSVLLLTVILFSLAGMLNAIFAKSFDHIAIVPTFVLTPLTYLGGIFYAIDDLPAFWQVVSYFNPVVYIISGFRYGLLGISSVNLGISLVMLLAFVIALYIIVYQLIQRGVGIKD